MAETPFVVMRHGLMLQAQPASLNILPLYIVLLALFPLIYALIAISPIIALLASCALWIWVNLDPSINLTNWLDGHGWFFDPFAWQFLFLVGATASYAEVAARIGAPKAVRAVAQACASNSIAVAIPCHRVVKSDGALSGYRWGVERKQTLLNREAAQ